MEQNWIYPDLPDRELLRKIETELNVPTIIAQILVNRGVDSFETARRFLKPKLEDLHDPFMMAGMKEAVDRLCFAIKNGERIMIFSDYDVDGVSGSSFLINILRELGVVPSFYVPNRLSEGYGISKTGILVGYKRGVKLIISIDCGITAFEETELASSLGIDMIITDHHEPKSELPKALAVINPKRVDCPYTFKELAGAGIAFKLAQALSMKMPISSELLYQNLDLIALGCAADIVPLVDENRILVKFGLERMSETKNLGLAALLENVQLSGKMLGTGQVVFIIAPRINAVGRMGNADRAIQLLTTKDMEEAQLTAQFLETENRRRQEKDDETLAEALEMAEESVAKDPNSPLILVHEGWHLGVIGIVASRLVERYYLPTILISLEDEIGKGSARSIPGFDLYEALRTCQDSLVAFGGHKYAAGLTIERENIKRFRTHFREFAMSKIDEKVRIPQLRIDSEITFEQIDDKLIRFLKYMAPYGPQNMKPVLVSRNLEVVGSPSVVGNNHIKFKARQNGKVFDCIGFGMGEFLYRVTPGKPNLDMAYVIEENEWLGKKKIQLRLKDLR